MRTRRRERAIGAGAVVVLVLGFVALALVDDDGADAPVLLTADDLGPSFHADDPGTPRGPCRHGVDVDAEGVETAAMSAVSQRAQERVTEEVFVFPDAASAAASFGEAVAVATCDAPGNVDYVDEQGSDGMVVVRVDAAVAVFRVEFHHAETSVDGPGSLAVAEAGVARLR